MATVAAVRDLASRPETVFVEVSATLTLPASERAVAVSTVIVRFWEEPAARSVTVVEVRPASADEPTAVRRSWRLAAVMTAFSTDTVRATAVAPTWRTPKLRAEVSTTALA